MTLSKLCDSITKLQSELIKNINKSNYAKQIVPIPIPRNTTNNGMDRQKSYPHRSLIPFAFLLTTYCGEMKDKLFTSEVPALRSVMNADK